MALRDIWVAPPGSDQPILKGVSLELAAGQAVALIGPSGAGKSTMGRAMLGIWPAGRGEVTLDGARHDQWDGEAIGAAMGYLPQTVELIDGTIGENIARFDPQPSSNAIIAAARMAGVHDLILTLAQGYDTPVSAMSAPLSAGQKQLIGLARAIYGDPFLIVLDEPNSNLDADGDAALARTIIELRKRGALVVVVTHRPSVLQVISHVAMMRDGRLADFGERDAVLARIQKQGQPQGSGGGAPPPNGGGQPPRVEGQA
jgi:ATP-binding cassette subfamily C protein